MIKTLPITSHHIAICEGNFLRLQRLLGEFNQDSYEFETVNPDSSSLNISFVILNRTKHTFTVEAKQISNPEERINTFILKIQISIDAKLAEVHSYQGEKSLSFFTKLSTIQSLDEKAQQNRFLTEWLESIFIAGIASKDSLQRIIKNE